MECGTGSWSQARNMEHDCGHRTSKWSEIVVTEQVHGGRWWSQDRSMEQNRGHMTGN